MSTSVTPRRRFRDEFSDVDPVENDNSSQSSKRRRVDSEATDSEDEPSTRPLLPDTYRRSPKGKGRARDFQDQHDPQDFLPGSIVRLTLTNFVTYTKAEFRPGPNLNMVIGPNGTGKSTLVCAICIGLGWSTNNLGRAKDVTEFVKHGYKTAEIEIELKADPERHSQNPVITHKINKDANGKSQPKSTYFIDGKKCTAKAAVELAKSFSIQVDNLCQFLPQDRVVEFAALNSVDLLTETQRAAAPQQVIDWHEQLKAMHKDQKEQRQKQQNLTESLKSNENRQRAQEAEVERLKEREAKLEEKRILEKLRPFAEYALCKTRLAEAKTHLKAVFREQKELEGRMRPNLDAIESKQAYHSKWEKYIGQRRRVVKMTEDEAENKLRGFQQTENLVTEADTQIQAELESGKKSKKQFADLNINIRKIELQLREPRPDFDSETMNTQIAEKRHRIRQLDNDISSDRQRMESLQEQARQRQHIIAEADRKKEFLESQAGRQTSKLEGASRDAARAWRWIEANRASFQGTVHGPPLIECSLKDDQHAAQVEAVLGNSELLAFTVTCQEDYKVLDQQLRRVMNLRDIYIRSSMTPLASFSAPLSDEQLRHMGFEGWLLDLIEGPEAVLAMLCDNSDIHRVPYTSKEVSEDQFQRMQESSMMTCVSKSKKYRVYRRREYGASTTSVNELRKARVFTDTAVVNTQEQQDIERSIVEARRDLDEIGREIRNVTLSHKTRRDERATAEKEKEQIEKEKRDKQSQQTMYDGLQPKLESYRQKLQDMKTVNQGRRERIQAIHERKEQHCRDKAQLAIDYSRSLETLRKCHEELLEAEIIQIEAESDLEQLKTRNADEQRLLEAKQAETEVARQAKDAAHAHGRRVQEQCQKLGDELTEEEGTVYERLLAAGWDLERLESDIAQLQASLEMLSGGNNNMIAEYTRRAQKIEDKRAELNLLERKMDALNGKFDDTIARWKPWLQNVIDKISEAFSENFSRIQCAGEVVLHEDEDFEQWAIHIKVKFRENEQLSILDAHRQSGGERAVSTIFYLMALQSLARAPFRVVDEINQGMDPRNERLVHSRMVEIACAEHTSQYFLITPKLLNNLKYHPNMKVHCIASGEYMPENHKELDFEMLAQRALQIRAVHS